MENEIVRLEQQLDSIERAMAAQEGLRGIFSDGQVDKTLVQLKVRGRELQEQLMALTGAGTIAQDGSTAVGRGAVLIGGDSHAAVVAGDNNTITHIINQYQSAGGTITERERLQKQMACYLRWMVDRFGKIVLRGIELRDKRVVELDLQTVYVPLAARAEGVRAIRLDEVLTLGKRVVVTGGPG